ncbi:MAG: phosphoribosylamine--glycine ligase [Saprospiraceae bacterium]|nr:phosphoribosylamine--glycine ligase [Saprospiraceae bacterium]
MNILLLGNGGREHALAWKINQSPICQQLFIAPGNAGTSNEGINIPIEPTDFESIKDLVLDEEIDIVVVGPELPLVKGIFDYFQADEELKHIPVIGPSAEAARLEGSKAYAKQFMQDFNIPTATYQSFTKATLTEGLNFIDQQSPPFVLKADGLAAGKGVVIVDTSFEAKQELEAMLNGKFGAASQAVVIEQFLKGQEFSVFVLTDGKHYKILPAAKDYKRVGEGDRGLNTGGMGSISPVPFLTSELMKKVEQRIIQPTIKGIETRQLNYRGFLFFGLIEVEGEPFVIEYNCRLGDPETQSVLVRLDNDLVEIFEALVEGRLSEVVIEENDVQAVTVILVAGGYPEQYDKGKEIKGLETEIYDSFIFHAGTKQLGAQVLTDGGRVLAITAYGDTFQEALAACYKNAQLINFQGKYYRKDIGSGY